MKFIFALVLSLMSFAVTASSVEVLQYFVTSTDPNENQNTHQTSCINSAYNLETKAMERSNDSTVKVRARIEYHPAGFLYCFAKFFSTERTNFVKGTQSFNFTKCQDKEEEIANEPFVVWTSYDNRITLPNGVRGCQVHAVRAVAL